MSNINPLSSNLMRVSQNTLTPTQKKHALTAKSGNHNDNVVNVQNATSLKDLEGAVLNNQDEIFLQDKGGEVYRVDLQEPMNQKVIQDMLQQLKTGTTSVQLEPQNMTLVSGSKIDDKTIFMAPETTQKDVNNSNIINVESKYQGKGSHALNPEVVSLVSDSKVGQAGLKALDDFHRALPRDAPPLSDEQAMKVMVNHYLESGGQINAQEGAALKQMFGVDVDTQGKTFTTHDGPNINDETYAFDDPQFELPETLPSGHRNSNGYRFNIDNIQGKKGGPPPKVATEQFSRLKTLVDNVPEDLKPRDKVAWIVSKLESFQFKTDDQGKLQRDNNGNLMFESTTEPRPLNPFDFAVIEDKLGIRLENPNEYKSPALQITELNP